MEAAWPPDCFVRDAGRESWTGAVPCTALPVSPVRWGGEKGPRRMARALCVVLADDLGQLPAQLGIQRLGTGTSPTLDYQLRNWTVMPLTGTSQVSRHPRLSASAR